MPPSRRVRPATAAKILAVMPWHAGGAQLVPAAHTWRLLNQLLAQGWTKAELARRLGFQHPALQLGRATVYASTARAVERLHAQLAGRPAPPRRTRWDNRKTAA